MLIERDENKKKGFEKEYAKIEKAIEDFLKDEKLEDYYIRIYHRPSNLDDILSSPDFSVGEFNDALTVERLCQAISADNYGINFSAADNSIERLNELLTVTNFYDIWLNKKGNLALPYDKKKLEQETKGYRGTSFNQLTGEQQQSIKKLNRALLELTYPQTCPKKHILKNVRVFMVIQLPNEDPHEFTYLNDDKWLDDESKTKIFEEDIKSTERIVENIKADVLNKIGKDSNNASPNP